MIILSGTTSALSQHLLPYLRDRFQVCSFDRERGDIKDPAFVAKLAAEIKPDIFINTIQFDNQEECEYKREEAYQINSFAPGYIASACRDIGSKLIHIGTTFLYSAVENREHSEADSPDPVNAYADSMFLGEKKIAENLDNYVIFRLPVIYGRGECIVKDIINHARSGEDYRVLSGQIISSVYAKDASEVIASSITMNVKGIFNLVNSGCCTMSDFAYAVVRLYEKASGRNLNFRLNELSYNDYISAAEPVLYNIISTQKITSELKIELRPWLQALEAFISENWQYL